MNVVICLFALLIDRIFGDPKKWTHPVVFIGRLIELMEKSLNSGQHRKVKGSICVVIVVIVTAAVVAGVVWISYKMNFLIGVFVEIIFISLALAQKSLQQAAMKVYNELARENVQTAREYLGWIVGRDTDRLQEEEIVRGVVETVSENTSDGVTAPLFYALLFGATGAWVYKAINTLDSMIGYKNERYGQFGFIAAKADDAVNYIPSRITGFLILSFTTQDKPQPFLSKLKIWLRDAAKHPSPNSGYLEAATAIQLGVQLGGENSYGGIKSIRAFMGQPYIQLNRRHILQSIQQMYVATILFYLIVGGIFIALTIAWS
ncbi:adenosylcobinamide-phosphate synthase CbiB [Ureibacillus sinduriensis]|uniref:Cobalamin biosynthesis protein CobD n=1 Tax=Ureibacillus sinduriensis BLB-1 = JCM 15800 TaxID=1384057 RepID=A0A0A3IGU5_9BACL|nr:adenosylcobinamide-phosphate synthase CbiB [Ureibacillus sinduriensis]KGR74062.1 cobalamin biosynthesis protein CobD [Ureibacillus sinduriensis BLB-1 = JCM 15800]